jgi:hypothetical protein
LTAEQARGSAMSTKDHSWADSISVLLLPYVMIIVFMTMMMLMLMLMMMMMLMLMLMMVMMMQQLPCKFATIMYASVLSL